MLSLLRQGRTVSAIGHHLCCSALTVEKHLESHTSRLQETPVRVEDRSEVLAFSGTMPGREPVYPGGNDQYWSCIGQSLG
jgi:hypothetical protein